MKLLAYTIGGQTIGIDITTWSASMLSGNTAFMAIADTGSTPTDYVDISSIANWDNFGGTTTLTDAEIKSEIVKLIPDTPTAEQYLILENYATVGLNSMTNILSGVTVGSVLGNGSYLTGVTDNKLTVVDDQIHDQLIFVEKITGTSATFLENLSVDGQFNMGYANQINSTQDFVHTRYNAFFEIGNLLVSGIAIDNYNGSGDKFLIGVDRDGVARVGTSGTTLQPIATGSTGGSPVWGTITGTLSNQTDLQNALNAKQNTSSAISGGANVGTGEGIYTGTTSNELQFKSLKAGTNITLTPDADSITIDAAGGGTGGTITTLSTTNGGGTTTTSTTDVLMTGMQLTSVPAGDYFLSFGTTFNHSQNGASITTSIYVGGTQVTNSSQQWMRGNAQGNVTTTHNYAGFPITVATTGNVEIYWQTDNATATSANRYMSLIKV